MTLRTALLLAVAAGLLGPALVWLGASGLITTDAALAEALARHRATVLLLVAVQAGLLWLGDGIWVLGLWITLFFVSFNVLEATLPSLISRMVPRDAKGGALGVYNTTQSIGLFLGGAIGGTLVKTAGASAVHVFGLAIAAVWLIVSLGMRSPAPRQGR